MAQSSHYCFSAEPSLLEASSENYRKIEDLSPTVALCQYKTTKAAFCVKKIDLNVLSDSQLEDLKKDVLITKQLKHKNILPYLCCFVNKPTNELWIVSPYCELGSASSLSKSLALSEQCIAFIIRDTLLAMDYLHSRGIIHRAIRGSHVLVYGPAGKCLLTGFKYSTSVVIDGKWQTAIHEYPSNARPNLNWLSPEVLEQNLLGYSWKSDIYSLGITCCELANGCVPFDEIPPTEMLLDKLTGNFPRLIDSTCKELFDLATADMTKEEQEKYVIYRNRRFSDSFHAFTVELCLVSDPDKRPSAAQLLHHSFITKNMKKYSSLAMGLKAAGVQQATREEQQVRKREQTPEAGLEDNEGWTFS